MGIWYWLDRPPCVRQRVVVALKSQPPSSLEGVFWAYRGPWIVLRDVRQLDSDAMGNARVSSVDGDAVIHRSNVEFIQAQPLVR